MLPPLAQQEADAALAVQELCEAMYRLELDERVGVQLLDGELRRFRARCPVASCRLVLSATPWVDGARVLHCRCGWRCWEAL